LKLNGGLSHRRPLTQILFALPLPIHFLVLNIPFCYLLSQAQILRAFTDVIELAKLATDCSNVHPHQVLLVNCSNFGSY
jgi:hypothetical protein